MIAETYPPGFPALMPSLEVPAAAATLGKRLMRAWSDDPDTAGDWLQDLAVYERLMAAEARMALYLGKARKVDDDGVVTLDAGAAADAAWWDFVGDLAAWRAHADEARAMLALLGRALDHIAAIPAGDLAAYQRASAVYHRLRHGVAVRPLPPAAPWREWRWPVSLKTWEMEAYRHHLIVCRQRLRLLAEGGRRAAAEEFGIREDVDLLHMVYPVAERDRLDERANVLGVDLYWSLMGPGSRRARQGGVNK